MPRTLGELAATDTPLRTADRLTGLDALTDLERYDHATDGEGNLTIRVTMDVTLPAAEWPKLTGRSDDLMIRDAYQERIHTHLLNNLAEVVPGEGHVILVRTAALTAAKKAARVFPAPPYRESLAPAYTPAQTLKAYQLLEAANRDDATQRGRAANALMDAFNPGIAPAAWHELVIFAQTITNPSRHTYVGATGGGKYDPCLICDHTRHDVRHPLITTAPLADLT